MKVAKIAAVVAAAGIVVAILVIGTPAFTTLHIAARSLAHPTAGASWDEFQQPTRSTLAEAIAQDPNDWKIRLIYARRLFDDDYSEEAAAEAKTDETRMSDFEQVIANSPEEVTPRAAYVRWLFQQRWDYLHPTQAEERARTWPGTRTGEEAPHSATRLGLVDAAEGQLRQLSEIEPDNAAWPSLLASCRFARLDDKGALKYLKEAGAKPRFSLDHRQELAATVDAYASLGIPRPEASLQLAVVLLFPELADMRSVARIAAALADEMEAEGGLREAAETRMAVIDVGRTMRRTGHFMLTALVGNAIEAIGYGQTDIKVEVPRDATDEEKLAAKIEEAKLRQEAFTGLLTSAGAGNLAPQYAHGREEGIEYGQAARAYIETPAGDAWWSNTRLLSTAYAAAPVAWLSLAVTLAALVVVGVITATVRPKSAAASSRTIVGASIVGGIVCLGLLVATAIIGNSYGLGGWLFEPESPHSYGAMSSGAASTGWGLGLGGSVGPGTTLLGIATVALVAIVGILLLRREAMARRYTTLFALVSIVLAVAFSARCLIASGFTWHTRDAVSTVLEIVLVLVSIAAIVMLWRARSTEAGQAAGPWIPLFGTVTAVVALLAMFPPLALAGGAGWPMLLIVAVPASVAAAALVSRIVAAARLPLSERPSYLRTLRSAFGVCLAWILVLGLASLIWLATWRGTAAYEVEQAYATSENQAVLRIMEESQRQGTAP